MALTDTQLRELYKRCDLITGDPGGENAMLDLDDIVQVFMDINKSLTGPKLCCYGKDTGKLFGNLKDVGNGFLVRPTKVKKIDGQYVIKDEDTTFDWLLKEFNIPKAQLLYTKQKNGEYKEKWVKVLNKVKEVFYLDEKVYVVETAETLSSDTGAILDTPKNREHYGFIIWNNKAYSPGLSSYHGSDRLERCKMKETEWRVGLEIEKQNEQAKAKLSHRYLYDRYKWSAESDSSLDNTGYELVTPIYDLMNPGDLIKDMKELRQFIDPKVKSNARAGGHINISKKGMDGRDLFDKISGYVSLLYAMYPKRARKDYSGARKKDSLKESPGKRAFYPKRDRLELRIFPEVANVEDAIRRLRLVKYMCKFATNRTDVVVGRLLTKKGGLVKIIKDMGYDPIELAKETMKWSAEIDEERFSKSVHTRFGKAGITITTKVLLTETQKKKLKKLNEKWWKGMPKELREVFGQGRIDDGIRTLSREIS